MDIDIDFQNRDTILNLIEHIPASIKDKDGNFKKHNSGVYLQPIPINPLTGAASIDYKEAESRGYFKIDFLNVGVYKDVKDEEHLVRLTKTEPIWELLELDEFTDLLFHIKGHGAILRAMKPKNIEQLAAVLAMIRPAKRHLVGQDWNTVLSEVWAKQDDKAYAFKRSHGTAYAVAIVVQMNLLCEQLNSENS